MKATSADPKGTAHDKHAPPAAKTSPLRLMILLSVLVVAGGALVYDWVIAPPRVKAAYDNLNNTILKHNELGVRTVAKKEGDKAADDKATEEAGKMGGLLYSKDIQKILGMTPSKTEKTEFYTVEYYRWWGWIPRNRNYITVLYIGKNPDSRHYSTHCANDLPELPGKIKEGPPIVDLTAGTNTESAAIPVAGAPPGMGPPPPGGGGAEGGQGKGKGRPAKSKGDESKKAEQPKPADEPKKDAAVE